MKAPVTRRVVLAHISVCVGCCCGRVDRGKPEVPVDWLKSQWKAHRLLKHVHLTISGCLGPCDVVNVVSIASDRGTIWLGGLDSLDHFAALVEWAVRVAASVQLLPLPASLQPHVFHRFYPALDATTEVIQ